MSGKVEYQDAALVAMAKTLEAFGRHAITDPDARKKARGGVAPTGRVPRAPRRRHSTEVTVNTSSAPHLGPTPQATIHHLHEQRSRLVSQIRKLETEWLAEPTVERTEELSRLRAEVSGQELTIAQVATVARGLESIRIEYGADS